MVFYILILLPMLLIPGCTTVNKPRVILGTPTIEIVKEPVKAEKFIALSTIVWKRYVDIPSVEKACNKLGLVAYPGEEVVACAEFNLEAGICTIHAVTPKFDEDKYMMYLGHEMLHCFAGQFHKKNVK